MDPGDIMRRSWDLYRAHPRDLIIIAAAVYVPLGVVSALLSLLGWLGVVVANLLNLAAIFFVQGALVTAVEDVRDGYPDRSAAEALGRARQRAVPLAAAGVLATIGILGGPFLLLVPGLVLLTWWLVLSPVIMLESRGVIEAFGRSHDLVRGNGWPVFGVVVLTLLVLLAFGLALGLLVQPLGDAARQFMVSAVGNTLSAPFAAVAWTLTYFRLRDIESARGPLSPA